MQILKGIGVSPGVAVSTAVVLDAEAILIPNRSVPASRVKGELDRLSLSIEQARDDLKELSDALSKTHGKQLSGIFDFHRGLLADPSLVKQMVAAIEKRQTTAEYAVSSTMRGLADQFEKMPDDYFSGRVKDVHDIEKRLLKILIGDKQETLSNLQHDVLVIAHDLLPSQTATLDKTRIRGFATDVGGRTSHTAIVARAMNIPAVVGLGDATGRINPGDVLIIDGSRGLIIVDPDAGQIEEYREHARQQKAVEAQLAQLRDLPAESQDGISAALMANIEFPSEIEDALARGADGIGLYRTEFLYLASDHEPTEEDHYAAYAEAVEKVDGRPLVIRTLDLGADKYTEEQSKTPEKNPFLGDRSIRLCLHDLVMFKKQLRAVLRASACQERADVRIMFPMISTIMELRQAKMVLRDVEEELEDEGIDFRRNIPVGMMIEVPSAALMAAQFAKEVDFFSIGTNDLIQYTLAVDRTNERVAGLFQPAHPAVLSLIRDVIRAGARNGISVSVCGEMAGEPIYTLLLMGLGLTTFSMSGPDIPEVKKVIRSTTVTRARKVARQVMSFDAERQVLHYLQEQLRQAVPEMI